MEKKNKHQRKIKDVERLLEDIDAILLSRFLRDMLIDYFHFNKDVLPVDFDVSLNQLDLLFKIFDALSKE